MVIFEKTKYLKNIKENGINANDIYAKQKLRFLIEDYMLNTTYMKNKIICFVKQIAKDYFSGLPDDLIEKEIEAIYDNTKPRLNENLLIEEHSNKTIRLYKSEMQIIKNLKDRQLMNLAYATLILHKFLGQYFSGSYENYYTSVALCDADIYRVAGLEHISGQKKNQLWQKLVELDLVRFYVKTNNAFKFNPEWLALNVFSVPFNVNLKEDKSNEEVYATITNYDNILIYLEYYLGNKNLIVCSDCGYPIFKSSNAKCLCENCADLHKKANKRFQYLKSKQQ